MKTYFRLNFISLALAIGSTFAFGKEAQSGDGAKSIESVFGGTKIESSGGYGAAEIRYSQLNHQDVMVIGGRGGWIINNTFVIGGAGYGTTRGGRDNNSISGFDVADQAKESKEMTFGYGGVLLEYWHGSDRLINYSVSNLLGAGGLGFEDKITKETKSYSMFIDEIEASLVVNWADHFRTNFGVGYRFVGGAKHFDISANDLSGFFAGVGFSFGKF